MVHFYQAQIVDLDQNKLHVVRVLQNKCNVILSDNILVYM